MEFVNKHFGVLVACMLFAVTCLAQNDDAPPTDMFLRRTGAEAIVIGDFTYFDGGEISFRGNPGKYPSAPVNVTLSIDNSQSWKPEEVEFGKSRKPENTAILLGQAMFSKASSSSFYIWGGAASFHQPKPQLPPALYRFDTDGRGGGSWTTETPQNADFFVSLNRGEGGAFTSSSDAGFWIGGESTERTAPNADEAGRGHIQGLLSFNLTTKAWANDSFAPVSPDGTIFGATATFVPTFGPHGLIMLLGGRSRKDDEASGYLGFGDVTFFDPVSKDWFSQTTTGQMPEARYDHCAVGVAGQNNTFEIFVYAGRNDDYQRTYDDVHVLSLPGFVWSKVDYTSQSPRSGHACVTVGQRQMLSIGGANSSMGNPEFWEDEDVFPQGLGVFDLTELQWKTQYDADAAAYQSPKVVTDWYENGGLDEVSWSSGDVSALFAPQETVPPNPQNSEEPESQIESSTSSPPVAAIAGGVAGGVAGLAALGALVWFCIRRRRAKYVTAPQPHETQTQEIWAKDFSEEPRHGGPQELEHFATTSELVGGRMLSPELDGREQRAELHGSTPLFPGHR